MKHIVLPRIARHVVLGLALSTSAMAQSPGADRPEGDKPSMKDRCAQMQQRRETMMAEMKKQDEKLTEQVNAMNQATGEQKVANLAAIVTQLVQQRAAMHEHMMKMHGEMMNHMMQHMHAGKGGAQACPMMKDRSPDPSKTGIKEPEHTPDQPGQ